MATRAGISALAAAWSAVCCAMPATAATQNATVTANIVKPLSLTSLQSLDLGTITLKPGTWSGATVGISRSRRLQLRQHQPGLYRRHAGRDL